MALTYGFYNSINHDRRYNALQMSKLFDGIITDGIFMNIGSAMVVTAASGLTVHVGIGRAWFNSTWTLNDAIYPVEATEADGLRERIDAVVLEIDQRETTRANRIFFKEGVASTTPQKPTMTMANDVYQYPLCYINRAPGSTEIVQSDIENCVGTSECPFITGILSTISTDELVKQWTGRLDELILEKELEYDKLLVQLRGMITDIFDGHIPEGFVYGDITDNDRKEIQLYSDIGKSQPVYPKIGALPGFNVTLLETDVWTENADGTYELDKNVPGLKAGGTAFMMPRRGQDSDMSLDASAFDEDTQLLGMIRACRISADDTLHFVATNDISELGELHLKLVVIV